MHNPTLRSLVRPSPTLYVKPIQSQLVALTGIELSQATRHQLHGELHQVSHALHTVELGIQEVRREPNVSAF